MIKKSIHSNVDRDVENGTIPLNIAGLIIYNCDILRPQHRPLGDQCKEPAMQCRQSEKFNNTMSNKT